MHATSALQPQVGMWPGLRGKEGNGNSRVRAGGWGARDDDCLSQNVL